MYNHAPISNRLNRKRTDAPECYYRAYLEASAVLDACLIARQEYINILQARFNGWASIDTSVE